MKLWSRQIKFLHILSSEDYLLIQKLKNPRLNRRFNAIGLLVLIILIGSIISTFLLTNNIFNSDNWIFNVALSLFISYIVTIIYVFLLYTITPPLLVDKKMIKGKKRKRLKKEDKLKFYFEEDTKNLFKWIFSLSVLVRLGFILIFSITLSQPVVVGLLEYKITEDIENIRTQYKAETFYLRDKYTIGKENELLKEYVRQERLKLTDIVSLSEKEVFNNLREKILFDTIYVDKVGELINRKNLTYSDYAKLNQLIDAEIESDSLFIANYSNITSLTPNLQNLIDNMEIEVNKKIDSHRLITSLMNDNTFYLRKVQLLSNDPIGLLITFSCVLVFIFPIFLKFRLRRIYNSKGQSFYDQKKSIEEWLVNSEYQFFKKEFSQVLHSNNLYNLKSTLKNLKPSLTMLRKYNKEKAVEIQNEIESYYNSKEFEFYNRFIDPPFNLKPIKENRNFSNYSEVFNHIKNES